MQSWSSKDFTADRAWGALDIHHGKHLLTVVDVPDIGLVGPVQAHGGAGKIGNVGSLGKLAEKITLTTGQHHAELEQ
jgi:hypothetical protein